MVFFGFRPGYTSFGSRVSWHWVPCSKTSPRLDVQPPVSPEVQLRSGPLVPCRVLPGRVGASEVGEPWFSGVPNQHMPSRRMFLANKNYG